MCVRDLMQCVCEHFTCEQREQCSYDQCVCIVQVRRVQARRVRATCANNLKVRAAQTSAMQIQSTHNARTCIANTISTSIFKSNTRTLKYRHPQCKHNASMCTANTNIRDVNTIRNKDHQKLKDHVQCKGKQCTFAMKIPAMIRHLICKHKQ